MTEWRSYVAERKEEELKSIIESEDLNEEKTRKFISDSFESGSVKITGTDIDKIMPPTRRFGGGNHDEKKQSELLESHRKKRWRREHKVFLKK